MRLGSVRVSVAIVAAEVEIVQRQLYTVELPGTFEVSQRELVAATRYREPQPRVAPALELRPIPWA